jgi:hypothetical protein
MFIEEDYVEHAEQFSNEYYISKLSYLSDIFRSSVHWTQVCEVKITNIIAVKVFMRKLDMWIRKLE